MMKVKMAFLVLVLSLVASNVEARGQRMMRQQGYTMYYTNAVTPTSTVVSPTNVVVQGTTIPASPTVIQTSGVQTATGNVVQSNGVVQTSNVVPAATGTSVPVPGTAAHGSAQWKAEQSARLGSVQHLGGGFGGGSYEGNGFGATPDQAIRNSCFWGQRTPIEIGVARGANGYYATIFYR